MMSLIRQIQTVTALSLQTLPSRIAPSLTVIVSVALVVGVLIAFLAMSNGFAKTLQGSGSDGVAIFLRSGAEAELNSTVTRDQVRLIEEAPGVARDAEGLPMVSPELYVVVDGIKKSSQTPVNLPMRGVGPMALAIRDNLVMVEGRMFEPGTNEIIVGRGILKEFEGFALGQELRFGTTNWRVVGVFAIEGSVFDSELWADLGVVQNLFNRGSTVQTVRAVMDPAVPETLAQLAAYSDNDPRLKLSVETERQYYADQSSNLETLVIFGWVLAVTLSLGALSGAINTMYTAIEARSGEMATLRAIGFGGLSAFTAAMVESILLALAGGLLGSAAAYLLFNGITASTLGGSFTQVVFSFAVSGDMVISGLIIALMIGLVGGFFPALASARQTILKLSAR